MFKKLDRYIIRKFLSTFFFTALLITMGSIVIHASEQVNKFIQQNLTFKQIVFDYYVHYIPWINGLMWPIFVLISVLFFTSKMAKDTEIIPILNAGVSYKRLMVPYMISASIIAGIFYLGNSYFIPKSNYLKNEFDAEFLSRKRKKTLSNNVHFFVKPDTKIYVKYYRKRDSTAQKFWMETFDEDGNLIKLVKAKKIKHKEDPDIWTLDDYSIRTINGLHEELITKQGEKLDTQLHFMPSDFIQHIKQMEIMTSKELESFIVKEKARGLDNTRNCEIELHRRRAYTFTILIMTIIAFSVASRKVRGGMGLHLAIGVVIGSAFELLSKFSKTFASNLILDPGLAIWMPNIIFGVVAVILIARAQK